MKRTLFLFATCLLACASSVAEILYPSQQQFERKETAASPGTTQASLSYEDGALSLNITDLVTQRDAGLKVTLEISEENGLEFVIKDEAEDGSDSECPFDVTARFEGVDAGEYAVCVYYMHHYGGYYAVLHGNAELDEAEGAWFRQFVSATEQKQSPCKKAPEYKQYSSASLLYENGNLMMDLKDFQTQCGARLRVTVDDSVAGELRFLIEDLCPASASCICPFDVSSVYEGIAAGRYEVYVDFFNRVWGQRYTILQRAVEISEGREVVLEEPSAVPELRSATGLLVLDNAYVLSIGFEGVTEIEVYDIAGRRELTLSVNGPSEIDLNGVDKGVHLVRAVNDGKTELLRFVK